VIVVKPRARPDHVLLVSFPGRACLRGVGGGQPPRPHSAARGDRGDGVEAVARLINPETPTHLLALAAAGLIGFAGNWIAAIIRRRAGRQLNSPALIADGNHARADSYVSLAVVASAIVVALGVPIADPLIGLGITAVIVKITWDSWWTIRGGHHGHSH
jgi:Cation efflux family